MTAQNIIRAFMKDRGHTYKSLAAKMGNASFASVSERLKPSKRGMTIMNLLKFMEALDCEVIIRSKLNDGKEWVLDNIDNEISKNKPKIKDFEYDEITDTWVRKTSLSLSPASVETSSSTSDALPSVNDTSKPKERRLGTIPLPDLSGYTKEEILEIVREHNEEENKRAMGIDADTPKPEPRKSVKIPLTPSAIRKANDKNNALLNTEEEP